MEPASRAFVPRLSENSGPSDHHREERGVLSFFLRFRVILIAHTSAHPGLERQLEVLAAPDVKAAVVRADPLEERSVYGEEAAGHRWRPNRFGRVFVPFLLLLRHRVPIELVDKG